MIKTGIDALNPLKRNKWLTGIVFFALFATAYALLKIYIYPPSANSVSYKNNNFYVFGLNIPSKLDFCGEKIPSNDTGIKKDLEKEFQNDAYWKTHSRELFNKAQRWFPIIEPILKEEGVPDDFKYLAVIESHLSNATSPAGASGFWQLVPSSANGYGLEVNSDIDERYNVEKATHAACAHIKDAYAVFHNWTLSAAAYNMGINGIIGALKKQKTDNYHDLMLNSETGSFVYRILAFKTLLSSPAHFGINRKKRNTYNALNLKVYKVDSTVTNLAHLAKHIGCELSTIRDFNPWLLGKCIQNPSKKTYLIKVPKNKQSDYTAYINDLKHNLNNMPGDHTSVENVAIDTMSAITVKIINYVVKIDEPLKNLADFFKVKEDELRKWNNLGNSPNAVKGQTLTIYNYLKSPPGK